jgi:YD repeat-containing protein
LLRGAWFGRSLLVGLIARRRRVAGSGLIVCVTVLAFSVLAPASASAEPLCTDTWTGPTEGSWASAEDWSSGVPTSSSVVCIGSGKTVTIRGEGSFSAGVIEDSGGLSIESALLNIADAVERSRVGVLNLEAGSLIGPASLSVTTSLSSGGSDGIGAGGTLIIQSAASATVYGTIAISEAAKLVNEGTFTVASGGKMSLSEGARIENAGTFNADSYISGFVLAASGASSRFINTGTFQTHLTGTESASIGVEGFENDGIVNAKAGILSFFKAIASGGTGEWMAESGHILFTEGAFSFTGGEWSGPVYIQGAAVTAEGVTGTHAQVTVLSNTFSVAGGSMTVESLAVDSSFSTLGGAGSLTVTNSLRLESSYLTGTGSLILASTGSGKIETGVSDAQHRLVNEGIMSMSSGHLELRESAILENRGTFTANDPTGSGFGSYANGQIVNSGTFQVTEPGEVRVDVEFTNDGSINEENEGHFHFYEPVMAEASNQYGGPGDPSRPGQPCPICGEPVEVATGNLVETQTDLAVAGRGVGLDLTRTYNSEAAAKEKKGAFGYGWSSSFTDYLAFTRLVEVGQPSEWEELQLHQATGATVTFIHHMHTGVNEALGSQDRLLLGEGEGAIITLPDQTKYKFASTPSLHTRLESVTDRDGNTTTLAYGGERLEAITDPSGRKLKLTYNAEGFVEQAEDPMGHVVKYTYEGGNLTSVTLPGESSPRWQFHYNGLRELTEMTDGRGGKTINEYSGGQVVSQTDPAKRTLHFEYEPFQTKIKNESSGSVTDERFTSNNEPSSITRGYGTASATTESFTYDAEGVITSETDGDGHVTKYGYDSEGNRTSMVDPDKDETKWGYDSTHDVITMTTPDGETTTTKRESHGNPEVIERPAPGGKTQTSKYKYGSHGELESVTDPLEHTWKYEYDVEGDRTAETDPEGNKRTWEYNEDSQPVATVSPRGNVAGGQPAVYTTTVERDAQGRPLTVTEPPREAVYGFAFGSKGSGNGQFEFPTLEAVTASGNVWVSDSSLDRLQEFNEKGEYQAQFGVKGTGAKEFKFPFGIAITPSSGNMYVSDYENYRVQEFSSSGTFIRMFGYGVSNGKSEFEICTEKCQVGLKGTGTKGQFGHADGIAIDSSGDVWVADETDDRLDEFKENGEFIKEFGAEGKEAGKIKQPVGLAYDDGNLYVAEAGNQRVQEFSTSGTSVRTFGSEGTGNGQFKIPYAIAAGPASGVLYVTDRENDRVQEFTATGQFLSSLGAKGKGAGQFELPTGVAATASEDLYISDHNNQRVQEWTGPSPRITKYAYDANGNLESVTDPNGDKTKYTYDADNELTKAEEPNKTIVETEYDAAGQVKSQTDGNKHTTKYERNVLEEITEEVDPKGRKTTKEYDAAGNLRAVTDAAKRTTTYTYDPANRLTEISYSDGKTHAIEYEYNKDGELTVMKDASGTTKNTYDELDRLKESENGNKEVMKYEYDLANDQTKITYPNTKSVTRAFDKDGRLEKITDWSANVTKFTYDADSDLTSTVFPSETKNEDSYAYNDGDQISEVKMLKSAEALASLAYTRDSDGQAQTITSKGLPGEEKLGYEYDPNDRLTKGATVAYEYDATNNATKIGTSTYKYDSEPDRH